MESGVPGPTIGLLDVDLRAPETAHTVRIAVVVETLRLLGAAAERRQVESRAAAAACSREVDLVSQNLPQQL